jgi:oligopeptide/dipeptide ABC transporter ATP-binding protein
MEEIMLRVSNLSLSFSSYLGTAKVLDNVGFEIRKGELFGLAGESGCGKSVTTYAILKLLPESAHIGSGTVTFDGKDLLSFSERRMQDIRGREISIVFQDPNTSLDPSMRIGDQITETYQLHMRIPRPQAERQAIALLERLKISHGARRMRQYPHQLSGGIKQRICFAMALIFDPKLMIADEFTTNLDVTVQAEMIRIVNDMRRRISTSILFITHDLSLIYQTCDSAAIMYAGQIVESGRVAELFSMPLHPYTQGLLQAVPTIPTHGGRLQGIEGFVPNLVDPPTGCRFHTRCPKFIPGTCDVSFPAPSDFPGGHRVYCHLFPGGR